MYCKCMLLLNCISSRTKMTYYFENLYLNTPKGVPNLSKYY